MMGGIARLLDVREEENEVDQDTSLGASDILNMKYAPLISCDVECTFCYRDNRESFLFENLKKNVFRKLNKKFINFSYSLNSLKK